jgi:hypothetical protein
MYVGKWLDFELDELGARLSFREGRKRSDRSALMEENRESRTSGDVRNQETRTDRQPARMVGSFGLDHRLSDTDVDGMVSSSSAPSRDPDVNLSGEGS